MIAKAKSIAHGGVSLGYITRQGKAQVVKLNHLPEDASPQAIYGYMKLHQKLREEEFQRRPLKNNMIRMEISPSKEESEGWNREGRKQLTEEMRTVPEDSSLSERIWSATRFLYSFIFSVAVLSHI